MTKPVKQHKQVGEEYLANRRPAATYKFPYPASALWSVLLNGDAWCEWTAITKVTWNNEPPFAVGTTRTVEVNDTIIEETFFGWEEGRRMAFRFEATNLPLVSAAAEDYSIKDSGDGGCELSWYFRISAIFPLNLLLHWQISKGVKSGMAKLEALVKSSAGSAPQAETQPS